MANPPPFSPNSSSSSILKKAHDPFVTVVGPSFQTGKPLFGVRSSNAIKIMHLSPRASCDFLAVTRFAKTIGNQRLFVG